MKNSIKESKKSSLKNKSIKETDASVSIKRIFRRQDIEVNSSDDYNKLGGIHSKYTYFEKLIK